MLRGAVQALRDAADKAALDREVAINQATSRLTTENTQLKLTVISMREQMDTLK
jgi:hypothetical protein